MYDVKPTVFRGFMQKKGLADKPILKGIATPCIVEYRKDDVLIGKVEAMSLGELSLLMTNQSSATKPVNKYWVRGEEWAKDDNGIPIQRMFV